jgi:hypothetical protein
MPFKSEEQRRLCWVLYNRDLKAGREPKWDCHEWSTETKQKLKQRSKKTKKSLVLL